MIESVPAIMKRGILEERTDAMDIIFEIGDESAPVGHALVYFTATDGETLATYVQTFPIPMNLSQYLPQMFAAMVPADQFDSQSATAMPPVVQPVEGGVAWLRSLAEARRDDLINAGSLYSTDPMNLMGMTQDAVASYAELYRGRPPVGLAVEARPLTDGYADLTEGERLAEMTRLVGRVRDTLEGPDAESSQAQLRQLARTLPAKYRADELLESAVIPGEKGQDLATLHLQRAYKMLSEDYLAVAEIERQIRERMGT
jgi:hypothetical protein